MFSGKRLSLVIPCYNEEEGLPIVLGKLPACIDEIILVDNNSTDTTSAIGKKFGATVLHEPRQGYGFAYQTGLAAATGDIIVTMDGDGTYPPEKIEYLLDVLLKDNLEFISACRFPLSDPKVMDPVSRFGNFLLTAASRILTGIHLKDSQSGMWVFFKEALPKLKLTSGGMPFSEEIKIEAIRRGLRFREVPIPYHERYGKKKIKKFRDGWKNLVFLVKAGMRR